MGGGSVTAKWHKITNLLVATIMTLALLLSGAASTNAADQGPGGALSPELLDLWVRDGQETPNLQALTVCQGHRSSWAIASASPYSEMVGSWPSL
jgi:hypothetical protein